MFSLLLGHCQRRLQSFNVEHPQASPTCHTRHYAQFILKRMMDATLLNQARGACVSVMWGSGISFGDGGLSRGCLSFLSPHSPLVHPHATHVSSPCPGRQNLVFGEVSPPGKSFRNKSRVQEAHFLYFRFMKLNTFIFQPLWRTGTDVHLSYCNYLSNHPLSLILESFFSLNLFQNLGSLTSYIFVTYVSGNIRGVSHARCLLINGLTVLSHAPWTLSYLS